MVNKLILGCLLLSAFSQTLADVYMHNPRGSNNRLNEKSATRRNGNRAFDSQNNNRGGYNVGDRTAAASNSEQTQYQMSYFTSSPKSRTSNAGKSFLNIEWTNQHGCGGNEDTDPHKLNCNMVIQYLCQPEDAYPVGNTLKLRDGTRTDTPLFSGGGANDDRLRALNRRNGNLRRDRVLQESWENYEKCNIRDRNRGLFTADQNVRGNSAAKHTRQNPNAQRRGYECPEERDYYPYWHPSEWKDIAVLAENASRCAFYKKESFNVKGRHECMQKDNRNQYRIASKFNNEKECTENNGEWMEFTNYLEKAPKFTSEAACLAASKDGIQYVWGRPMHETNEQCLVALKAPECKEAMWSRVNHLGNGKSGQPLSYKWTLPHFPSGKAHRCFLRVRYNISTDDYDPVRTDSRQNENRQQGTFSPVTNNPQVNIGASNSPLRLAINTAQYGRTFQDRSHMFFLKPRPGGSTLDSKTIHNLNVRGKRGNIVQVYPAVEYDFYPTNLAIRQGELVHIQWTGSNTHNNGPNGGDGQTGDAGEGTSGTDRSNIVQVKDRNENFPLPFENADMFTGAKIHWTSHRADPKRLSTEDIAVSFASSGYYSCLKRAICGAESVESKAQMQNQLNNAPASYGGMLMEFKKGKYHYICSRNNNFTNRSQKGTIEVL